MFKYNKTKTKAVLEEEEEASRSGDHRAKKRVHTYHPLHI